MPFRRDAEGLNGVEKGKIPKLDITNLKATPKRHNKLIFDSKDSEYVLNLCAWSYANGPLHSGGQYSCYFPPDIQYRF